MKRFILFTLFFIAAVSFTVEASPPQAAKKVLVLGFDGMDPVLLEKKIYGGRRNAQF